MKAIQRGIVALIAVCWALAGCAAGDTEEETGTLEQATISSTVTDNRVFFPALNQYGPFLSPSQNADAACGRDKWNGLQGYGTLAGPKQFGDILFALDTIVFPNPPGTTAGLVCPESCFNRFCAFPGVTTDDPTPGGLGQYHDFNVGISVEGTGSPTGIIATTSEPTQGGIRKGYRVLINADRVTADANAHGVSRATVYTWLMCRHMGRAIGLATTTSQVSCMGQQPTTAAQYAARSFWTADEQEQIRTIFLSRPSTAPEL